jgi:hypothetical protein
MNIAGPVCTMQGLISTSCMSFACSQTSAGATYVKHTNPGMIDRRRLTVGLTFYVGAAGFQHPASKA